MDKIYVKERTVYGVLEALDNLFSPGTTKFSNYVKVTSDFHGFLRTAFAKQSTPFKDRKLSKEVTCIVVGSEREIDEKLLRCEWTDGPHKYEKTLSRFQIFFTDAQSVADELRCNQKFGYPVNYVVQIESGRTEFEELLKLLKTSDCVDKIDIQRESFAFYIPSIAVMFDFDQRNRAHQFDLWHHCLHTALNLPRNLDDDMLYLAALLHDIGKPDCQRCGKREDDPNMYYYGHPQRSMEIVRDRVIPELITKGVLFSQEEQRRLLYYVGYHDDRVSLHQKHLKRHLQLASLAEFKNLMRLQVADATAHIVLPVIEERIRVCERWADGYADEVYLALRCATGDNRCVAEDELQEN